MRETVLYYAPEGAAHTALLKGVLVQMEIKIKNLTQGRCEKKIGFLAGMDGFNDEASMLEGGQQVSHTALREELMVFCGFTEERLDELYDHLMEERRQFEQR